MGKLKEMMTAVQTGRDQLEDAGVLPRQCDIRTCKDPGVTRYRAHGEDIDLCSTHDRFWER